MSDQITLDYYPINKKLTKDAIKQVGDGKTPNKFFVTIGSSALDADYESEIELLPEHIGGVTEVFLDRDRAIEFANDVMLIGTYPKSNIGFVMVEDRLNGVILDIQSVRDSYTNVVMSSMTNQIH